ncbi:MAG TPA: urease accessory protein UreD, partial [Pseudonocardiaceae bacterium]
MDAAATFAVDRRGVHWLDAPPLVLRPTGADCLHLLHTAGGPLGGDRLRLTGTVGTGRTLSVDSVGATVVQPGHDDRPADFAIALDLAAGACLTWAPEPTVVCAGADFRTRLDATLDPDADLFLREVLVLGRSDEAGGRFTGGLSVTVGDEPLVCHENLLDGADPELSGPAGSGGHRVHGMVLAAGRHVRPVDERAGRTGCVSWAVLP